MVQSIYEFRESLGTIDTFDDLDHILASMWRLVVHDIPGRQLAMVELTVSSIRDGGLGDVAKVSYRAFRQLFVDIVTKWASANSYAIDCEVYGRLLAAIAEGAIISWLADPDQSRVEDILAAAATLIESAASGSSIGDA